MHFFLGKSTAPTVAAADKLEQHPSAVLESVGQTGPKTMQLHIEEAAITSARGKGKMSPKTVFQNPMLGFYMSTTYRRTTQFWCFFS